MDEMKTTVRTLTFSTNMSPRPPLPLKVGGHDPPAPMGAPPLVVKVKPPPRPRLDDGRSCQLKTNVCSPFSSAALRCCHQLIAVLCRDE